MEIVGYRVIEAWNGLEVGDEVQIYTGYTYGLVTEDEQCLKMPCVAVVNESLDGFVVIPREYIKPIFQING